MHCTFAERYENVTITQTTKLPKYVYTHTPRVHTRNMCGRQYQAGNKNLVLHRGGHNGGAGGAQATPGILIFQKQVTPCHQIR